MPVHMDPRDRAMMIKRWIKMKYSVEADLDKKVYKVTHQHIRDEAERSLKMLCEQARHLHPDPSIANSLTYNINMVSVEGQPEEITLQIELMPPESLPYFRAAHGIIRSSFPEYINNILDAMLKKME